MGRIAVIQEAESREGGGYVTSYLPGFWSVMDLRPMRNHEENVSLVNVNRLLES